MVIMGNIVILRNVSFVVFCLGFVCFFLPGFSAPDWIEYTNDDGDSYREGLWAKCLQINGLYNTFEDCSSLNPNWTVSQVKATQANMCMALILAVVSLVTYIYWMTMKSARLVTQGMTDVGRIALYTQAAAGCFNFLAILIYGFYYLYYGNLLHYAFALSVVSSLIFTCSGFACICISDCGNKPVSSPSHQASMYPTSHLEAVSPPGQSVYIVPGDQGQNVMYNADFPGPPRGVLTQAPPYTPTIQETPPQYQPEWNSKCPIPNGNHDQSVGASASNIAYHIPTNDTNLANSGTDAPGLINPLYNHHMD